MAIIADILMTAGAFGAAVYCYVLSGRLKRFTALESGMGGAIAVLSAQVDDMTVALNRASSDAVGSASGLEALTLRGESVAVRLELLIAALHDLPDPRPAKADPEADEFEPRLRVVRRRSARSEMEAAE